MLRVAAAVVVLATAYCGAKGPPQPPAREAPDAGAAAPAGLSLSPSTSTSDSGSGPPAAPPGPKQSSSRPDAGPP